MGQGGLYQPDLQRSFLKSDMCEVAGLACVKVSFLGIAHHTHKHTPPTHKHIRLIPFHILVVESQICLEWLTLFLHSEIVTELPGSADGVSGHLVDLENGDTF